VGPGAKLDADAALCQQSLAGDQNEWAKRDRLFVLRGRRCHGVVLLKTLNWLVFYVRPEAAPDQLVVKQVHGARAISVWW
jgi:hypothetical protein